MKIVEISQCIDCQTMLQLLYMTLEIWLLCTQWP